MFESLVARYYLEPQVVHRLPGRLRVRVAALLHIQAHKEEFEGLLERLLRLPEGVRRPLLGSIHSR